MGTINMKKALFAAALAATTMVGNAYASSASISYGETTLTVVTPVANFVDYYNLILTGTTSFTAQVTENELRILGVPDPIYDIANPSINYGLYNAVTNQLVTNTSSLATGSYQFRVSGTATGLAGGQYTIKMNVASVTAVPEPETNALMLLGLGVIGFVARRKFA